MLLIVNQNAAQCGYCCGVLTLAQAICHLMPKERRIILQGFTQQ
jgi:hypothetical protein